MLTSYPALFYYTDTDESEVKYFISLPDFPEQVDTQGLDIADALFMASDWLGIVLADCIENNREIPLSTPINCLSLEANNPFIDDLDFEFDYDKEKSFLSMVLVDVSEYLENQTFVEKKLAIPQWADKLGRTMHLDFSEILTDAILKKKCKD